MEFRGVYLINGDDEAIARENTMKMVEKNVLPKLRDEYGSCTFRIADIVGHEFLKRQENYSEKCYESHFILKIKSLKEEKFSEAEQCILENLLFSGVGAM